MKHASIGSAYGERAGCAWIQPITSSTGARTTASMRSPSTRGSTANKYRADTGHAAKVNARYLRIAGEGSSCDAKEQETMAANAAVARPSGHDIKIQKLQ